MITYGMCPSNLQNPHGKVLSISVTGSSPYIIYNEAKEWAKESIEFEVMDVYVKKFGLIPKFIRAAGYEGEGSVIEMVRKIHLCHNYEVFFAILYYRSAERSVNLG